MKLLLALILGFAAYPTVAQEKASPSRSEERVVLAYFNEVINNKELAKLETLFHHDFVFHGVDGNDQQIMKDSSLNRFLSYLFRAFPDLHYTVNVSVAQNTDVAMYVTAAGTHKNEFHGFPASNNKVSFKEAFFFRVADNKIKEAWGIVDLEGLKDQLKKR